MYKYRELFINIRYVLSIISYVSLFVVSIMGVIWNRSTTFIIVQIVALFKRKQLQAYEYFRATPLHIIKLL